MNDVQQDTTSTDVHEVYVEETYGAGYTARLHGTVLGYDEETESTAYRLDDGRLVVHGGPDKPQLIYLDDAERLQDWLEPEAYVRAMKTLGLEAVVDIGEA